MATLVRELDKRVKGSLGETEDWWRLMREEDGSFFVEHEWSHTKLKSLMSDEGEKRLTVEEFLASDLPKADRARAVLLEMKDRGEV